MNLGQRIKELRKENGYSQEKIAEAMNVTSGAVCKWESGLSSPDLGNLVDIAKFFGVSVDYLLGCEITFENEVSISEKLGNDMKKRNFIHSLSELSSLCNKYPNSFCIHYAVSAYLFTEAFEQNDSEGLEFSLRYTLRALELYENCTDSTITRGRLITTILAIYQRLERPQEAIDFIAKEKLENNELTLGICYEMLHKTELSLKYLSKNMLNSLTMLINGQLFEMEVLHKLKRDEEAIEISKWLISLLKPIIKKNGVVFEALIAVIYAYQSALMYPNGGYLYPLRESIHIACNYKKDFTINPSNTNFFFDENNSLSTISEDLFIEIKNQVSEVLPKDRLDEYYKVMGEIIDEEKGKHYIYLSKEKC